MLQELAGRYPDSFEVVETLGLIYAERGEVKRALPLLEAGCRAKADSPEAAANLGAAYLQMNRIRSAVKTLATAASLDAANGRTQSNYGRALMMDAKPGDAAKAFAAAYKQDPSNEDILYNWALAEFDSGDVSQVSTILERIPASSRSAQVELLGGDAEEKLGHFDRALEHFQTAAELEPSEGNLNTLGLELLKHWSFDAATKIYDYGLAKYPSSVRLQTGAGIARYGSAQYPAAAKVFAHLLTGDPNRAILAKFLGQSCAAIVTEFLESCDLLNTYVENHPIDGVAARLEAQVILAQKDAAKFDLARKLLQRSIAREPGSAENYYQMGLLDQAQERWSESVTMLRRADTLRPWSSRIHLRLALAYTRLGQKARAHNEAELQNQFRESEDADMEAQRKELTRFILAMR